MALTPDDVVQDGYWNPGTEGGIDVPAGVTLPTGVDKSGQYYAHYTVYRDGRRVIEWLKRGSGGGEGKPDTVVATSPTETVPAVASKWQEEKAKEEGKAPATRTINGVPHQVTGKDANGQDIWSPVVTATGPAIATTTTSRTPEEAAAASSKATEDERERAYHRGLGHGNLTHAEYEAKLDKDQVAANAALTQARADKNQERITAAQETQNQIARDRLQLDRDKQNMPDVKPETIEVNGQRYTRVTRTTKDGKIDIQNFGPDGKPIAAIPGSDKDAFVGEPEGAPEQAMGAGQLTAGLRQYSTFLDAQVKLWRDSGGKQGVSPTDATKLMGRRISLAESALKEREGITGTQKDLLGNATTQRGQSLTETQSRRGAAERIATDVNTRGDARLKFLAPGNAADHIAARQEEMQNALAYAGQWGGLRESPEVNPDSFPALAEMRRASMAGIQTAAAGGPQIFDARAIQQPVPDPAAAAAATMANPVFRPAPAVQGSVADPIVPPAANPIDGSPIVLPTQLPTPAGPTPSLGPGQDLSTTPQALPVNPVQGQPGHNQNAPVGKIIMDPAQMAASAASRSPVQLDPARYGHTPENPLMPPGISPRFMQETRYGQGTYFDPDLAGEELSLRLGIDPEIMRQARAGLYG